eukprot:TRINITY_DN2869_c0_g1_i1.p2 TRINITY_DN2869_c0_g1~~TRINITY_DN2869_c0_g1_i1.p2  ORF type:complete len:760 (+),score=304.51 TRINITY_DN2869_c0_g1_i1:91-2280(+)
MLGAECCAALRRAVQLRPGPLRRTAPAAAVAGPAALPPPPPERAHAPPRLQRGPRRAAALRRAVLLRARRAYAVASPDTAHDRDPRQYLLVCNDLGYLRSPRALMSRSEICIELCQELVEHLQADREDPRKCLQILDTMSNIMCLVLDPAEATRNTHPREEFRDHATRAFNYAFHFMSQLNTNRGLYEPLVKLMQPGVWETLTHDQQRNAIQMKNDMDSNGIHLPQAKRDLVVQLTDSKEQLAQAFVNVEMQGLNPNDTLKDLISTRHRLAELLSCESYAHWVMKGTMAEHPLNAWRFLNTMSQRLQERAMQEYDILCQLKRQVVANPGTPHGVVTDFERADLTRIYRERKFRNAAARFKEYLSVANVWRGLQLMCKELFGVEIEKTKPMRAFEIYHPTVEKYVLYDEGRAPLGTIYADLIDRPGKMQTAGHFTVQLGTKLHAGPLEDLDVVRPPGDRQLPIVIFTCNAKGAKATSTATKDDPEKILLEPEEVVTFFHEFGHAMHTIFGQTDQQNLAGTRSSIDYVETFSQFFEYYARDYRVVSRFAKHHDTGETVPKELVETFADSEHSFAALEQLDQIILACVDLVYHGERPFSYFIPDPENPEQMLKVQIPEERTEPLKLMMELAARHTPVVATELGWKRAYPLQHLSNYPAAYYSYAYSRVVATAIWQRFFEAQPLSRENGEKLRSLMSLGASMSPREMLRTMLGEQSNPEAMLEDAPDVVASVR